MRIPDWIQNLLRSYENQVEPFQEVEIAQTLASVSKNQENLSDEDRKVLVAEWSAFLFGENRSKDGRWGTYFEPMMSAKKVDGTEILSPDIIELDSDTVNHWEERAVACPNAVMRARYADVVWDLKYAITKQKPNPEYARIAVDSYLEAADSKLYGMEVTGIQWLGRALDLARSISDSERTRRVADFMFEFYDRVAQPRFVGTWLFLFDNLYGEKFINPEQESRIIADLEAMLTRTSDASPSATGVYENLDPWGAEAAAERLAKHYRRKDDKASLERVTRAYGSAFEHMARQANPMLARAWLQPVVERYEREGLRAEAEQLQLLAGEKGKNIASDLKTVSVQVEVKKDDVDKLIDQLLGSGDLNASLARIAAYFIPKTDDTRQLLARMRVDAPFLSMIPISVVDKDGFPTGKIGPVDDDAEGRLHQQLGRTIGFYQPFLDHALTKLRERYGPTVDEILNFLCLSPLFAQGRTGLLRDGLSAYAEGDFVKAIHVLVPQVEHTLRDFLGRIGIPPRKTVRGHPGITDAKGMNDILRDSRVQEALTENLWRYLLVVYIERRGGLNLRNDLAHGLVSPEGFNKQIADRVFHTLLALSLMRGKKEPEAEQSVE